MSAFSCLNILKSNAKQLSRAQGISRSAALEQLARQAKFKDLHELITVAKRTPTERRLLKAALGVEALEDAVHKDNVWAELDLALEGILSGSISETNAYSFVVDGLETKTASYDEQTGVLTLNVSFTYRGTQDPDRPFAGSAYFLHAIFRLLRRDGKWSLAEGGVELTHGDSDLDRDWEEEWQDRPPKVSMATALMEYLGLTEEEAESIADVNIIPRESNDGMTVSYWLDFDSIAQEPLRSKLIELCKTLLVEVDLNFFDRVEFD